MKCMVTGISGSGRIELLEELSKFATAKGRKVAVYDMTRIIQDVCTESGLPMVAESVLDIDRKMLRVLRMSAMKDLELHIRDHSDCNLHLIGVHATFRWKHQLIPGFSFRELINLQPDRCLSIVDDVSTIYNSIKENPKWNNETIPTLEETQYWLMEEEFTTSMLADLLDVPMFLVARRHSLANLHDLFFSKKKRIYLSYPITAIRESNPELLKEIQGPMLKRLEENFIVFNPLAIKDMSLTLPSAKDDHPGLFET